MTKKSRSMLSRCYLFGFVGRVAQKLDCIITDAKKGEQHWMLFGSKKAKKSLREIWLTYFDLV